MKNSNLKKYDTPEKRIKCLRKRGNIVTFKEKFYPNGTANPGRSQIIVFSLKKDRSGWVKIVGSFYDSKWYKNMEELQDAIDWDWMEEAHAS